METETSWTAVIALVISIIAIILIIIIVFLFRTNSSIIANQIDTWSVRDSGTTGTTTTPEAFVASPNSILRINSSATATYAVGISPYPDISSVVVNGRTTIFKIVHTEGTTGNPITVMPTPGSGVTIITSTPSGSAIAYGTTATYIWVTPTTVQRIS
jgi:hypothetical protein